MLSHYFTKIHLGSTNIYIIIKHTQCTQHNKHIDLHLFIIRTYNKYITYI